MHRAVPDLGVLVIEVRGGDDIGQHLREIRIGRDVEVAEELQLRRVLLRDIADERMGALNPPVLGDALVREGAHR